MNQRDKDHKINISSCDVNATRSGRLSRWLIRHAARTAPLELSERLEEEWLADLGARSSKVSRLRFVIGAFWATRIISHDYAIARLPVAVSAFAAGVAPTETPARLFSRRTTVFALVAILHVVVFYAFVSGLSSSFTKVNTSPLQNRVINEPHPQDVPPLPPPNLNPVKLDMPKLDADITVPSDDTKEVFRADESAIPAPPQVYSPPATLPVRVARLSQGGPGAGFPNPDDYYPSVSRHIEEQGAATVRVCVDAAGRLTSDPTLAASSGSSRLDEGALKLARAGSGHYRASTEDGLAINSCYAFRIRFQIRY